MVLNELGGKISAALKSFTNQKVVDEQALEALLKEVCGALLQSDVNVRLVQELRNNIKASVKFDDQAGSALNRKRILHKAVMDELRRLVDPGVAAWQPKRGKPNVLMMVGLQGSGKTTSCTKLAYFYQRKGFKVGLVCADTFRAGAFDQLKQNAAKANLPYYGSYSEADPAKIASDGVAKFRKDKFDLIIVDTSGRHKQEQELLDEMLQISAVVNPDHTIFVMDSSIGQAADGQARAFKAVVDIGSVIITKMDGHAKGGGAISAVAATQSPIIFIGTGEHIYDLEKFEPTGFISSMLGMGNLGALMETVQDMNLENNGTNFLKKIEEGKFSLRDMKEQFEAISKLGPLNKVLGMMPGVPKEMIDMMGRNGGQDQIRYVTTILDSMTEAELDSDATPFDQQPSRKRRIAQGSGRSIKEVDMMIAQYRQFSAMIKKMGGPKGLFSQLGASRQGQASGANLSPLQRRRAQENMARAMSGGGGGLQNLMSKMMGGGGTGLQDMMSQMMGGGGAGLQDMMSQMMGGGGAGLQDMMSQMMGGGGAGMPDMSALQQMPRSMGSPTSSQSGQKAKAPKVIHRRR
ncbi:Signal recognition particle [Massospora cicadina]|nr:Signal recognition particle [Massospora cicadina]